MFISYNALSEGRSVLHCSKVWIYETGEGCINTQPRLYSHPPGYDSNPWPIGSTRRRFTDCQPAFCVLNPLGTLAWHFPRTKSFYNSLPRLFLDGERSEKTFSVEFVDDGVLFLQTVFGSASRAIYFYIPISISFHDNAKLMFEAYQGDIMWCIKSIFWKTNLFFMECVIIH